MPTNRLACVLLATLVTLSGCQGMTVDIDFNVNGIVIARAGVGIPVVCVVNRTNDTLLAYLAEYGATTEILPGRRAVLWVPDYRLAPPAVKTKVLALHDGIAYGDATRAYTVNATPYTATPVWHVYPSEIR